MSENAQREPLACEMSRLMRAKLRRPTCRRELDLQPDRAVTIVLGP